MTTNPPIKTFRDLDTWKEGHKLVLLIYEITDNFPKHEVFGLISQMKRASISITSNIAEGFARETYKDKIRFYFIARGSVIELENQLIIAKDVGFIREVEYMTVQKQIQKTQALINGLIKKSKTYL